MAILSSHSHQVLPNNPPNRAAISSELRRWLQPLVLIGLGLYFLYDLLSGKIAMYVNDAQFGWVPWLGSVLFLAIGGVKLFDTIHAPSEVHEHDHVHEDGIACETCETDHVHSEHDHEHSHAPSWLRLMVVAIPLLIGIIVPAKPLGASAIQTSGISGGASTLGNLSGSSAASAFAADPSKRTVLDWVRAFSSSSNISEFTGQQADLIGFVYRDIRFDNKPEFMVARFAISCCVADASAMGVTVQNSTATNFKADSWVRVTGKITIDNSSGSPVPVLLADKIEPVSQPEHPYLYP